MLFRSGTIAMAEPIPFEFAAPGEWRGHCRTITGRKGPIGSYFVRFDWPTDDGPGDGPDWGAGIEGDCRRLEGPA